MASYAPLLINVNGGQWGTNLIGYNGATSYGSPSYYAQALFAEHLGDGTPKVTITGGGKRFYYSASVGSKDHVLHLKLVNASNEDQPLTIELQGAKSVRTAKAHTLHAATYEATNTINDPEFIHPTDSVIKVSGGSWKHAVPGLTIEVLDIPLD
jgi:alpha-L-arabinofuranosidase